MILFLHPPMLRWWNLTIPKPFFSGNGHRLPFFCVRLGVLSYGLTQSQVIIFNDISSRTRMQLVILFVAPSGRSDGKFGKVDICFRTFFYGVSSCEPCDDIHPINCLLVSNEWIDIKLSTKSMSMSCHLLNLLSEMPHLQKTKKIHPVCFPSTI